MSSADFFEWLTLMLMIPVSTAVVIFRFVTAFYVYFDTEERSKSRVLAAGIAIAVFWCYWPISFLAYIACSVMRDRRRAECANRVTVVPVHRSRTEASK